MAPRKSALTINRAGDAVKTFSRGLETQMRKLAVVACSVFLGTCSYAQINVRTLTLAGLSDCMTEAIATKSVADDSSFIIFSCNGARARTLYNFLGEKIHPEVVQDRNGKFENRAFGNSACYHRLEDQDGKTADEFRCDLIMTIGNILKD
jgi:hypothetical protein